MICSTATGPPTVKKKSADREKSIVESIRAEKGPMFVRDVDPVAILAWYDNPTNVRELAVNTAERQLSSRPAAYPGNLEPDGSAVRRR
jgi:hypothetical protein